MGNGNNGNGGVTVKFREKDEKILLSKFERVVARLKKEHREPTDQLKKKIVSKWGIDKLVTELVKLNEQAERLENQAKEKLGYHYSYHDWKDWRQGTFKGDKLGKEVEAQANSKIDIEQEEQRLNQLKDELLEELWLCGQNWMKLRMCWQRWCKNHSG